MAVRLPGPYQDWSNVFSHETIQAVLEHSQFDHQIDYLPKAIPAFDPLYPRSTSELKAMKTFLDNNSMQGKIQTPNSVAASPILLIPTQDGLLPLCIDYGGLNKRTGQDCYLPGMYELRDRPGKARI